MKNYLLKLGLLLAAATFFVFYACNDKDKEKTYTITYDLNGGTGTVPPPQTYTPSSTKFTLNDGAGLTKPGFTFGGWSIAADKNTPVANPYVPTANITLYAIWIPVYTVTYDLNGGTGTTPAQQTYTQGGTGITLNDGAGLTKSGFTFGGWSIAADKNTPVAAPYVPTANITLYAIWLPVYTVTYDPNGGTGTTPAPQTYTLGGTGITLNDGAGLTKPGFTFGGWGTAANSTTPVAVPYVPTASATLYAIWVSGTATYTVSFNLNFEGSGDPPASQTYTAGGQALTLPVVTRAGHTLAGWATTATGREAVANPYTPAASATLYAIWVSGTATYTVTYDLNGGAGTPPPAVSSQGGSPITLSDGRGLTKTDFVFRGWSTSPSGTPPVPLSYIPAANITLYAIWVADVTYTVTYNLNGGTGTPPEQGTSRGGLPVLLNDGQGLARTGFVFTGWGTAPNSTTPVEFLYIPTANVTLYAIWVSGTTTYTVTYDLNGGTGTPPASQTATVGSSIRLPDGSAGLTKEGFVFAGWSTSPKGTPEIPSEYYRLLANVTLYAVWGYLVTYNTSGATGIAPDTEAYTDTPLRLPNASGFAKAGYTFRGWASSAGGTSPVPNPYTPTAHVTLYAIWQPATTYTVTYNLNGGTGTTPAPQTYNGTPLVLHPGSGLAKAGYAFGGWSSSASGTSPAPYPYTPTAHVTLYAIWTPNTTTYTVTYDPNGGSGIQPAPQAAAVGFSIRLNNGNGLTRAGFVFAGWATSPNGAPPIADEYYTPSANITLYAVRGYTVTYNTSGATGTIPESQIYSGMPLRLPNGSGLAKSGYAFMGWASSAGGTSPFTDPYTPTANVSLYAIWRAIPAASFTLRSTTYTRNGTIPPRCGRTSPQLSWTNAPTDSNVAMYVLVFFDVTEKAWHFRREFPTSVSSLIEGAIPGTPFGPTAYNGPAPGDGRVHTYQFKLYAVRSGYNLMNFGVFTPDGMGGGTGQTSWAELESANAEYIVDKSNAYSGTFAH